ncbi:hypothetical protein P8452_22156 [Trifolium repens]|nr:hypothetical protein P8452_22156 [Trifolium repens]
MFDPTKKHHQPNNSFDLYDETRHETSEATNYNNMWPLKKPQLGLEDDEPRWSVNSPHYRSLSPVSRTEAIVNGQKELMEMVRNMPESNYELSLKDLVEHHHRVVNTTEENTEVEEEEKKKMKKNLSGKKMVEVKKNGKIDRDGGFYLKVGLPFFNLGSKEKKKKKKESKVSPRPSISDGHVKEKEWWKKSNHLSVYKESDDSAASSMNSNGSIKSSTSSSSNSSIRSRRMRSNSIIRREKGGGRCWPLFRKPKIQAKK